MDFNTVEEFRAEGWEACNDWLPRKIVAHKLNGANFRIQDDELQMDVDHNGRRWYTVARR